LTDLHTHILPGIDDGAKCVEDSLEMLCRQKESGVERVALTPHFYPLREELQDYITDMEVFRKAGWRKFRRENGLKICAIKHNWLKEFRGSS